jgi:hypothetical protein
MVLYSFFAAAAATGRGDRMASKDKPWPRTRRALQEDIWSKRVEKRSDSLILFLLNEGMAEERELLSHVCHKYAEGREGEM